MAYVVFVFSTREPVSSLGAGILILSVWVLTGWHPQTRAIQEGLLIEEEGVSRG